jgi:hypothetical protein
MNNTTDFIYPHITLNGVATHTNPDGWTDLGLPIAGSPNIRTFITVFHPEYSRYEGNEASPARINWSAIGSVSTETANLFIEALTQAVKLCDELNAVFTLELAALNVDESDPILKLEKRIKRSLVGKGLDLRTVRLMNPYEATEDAASFSVYALPVHGKSNSALNGKVLDKGIYVQGKGIHVKLR